MEPAMPSPYRAMVLAASPLRQGEILTDLEQFRLNVASLATGMATGKPFKHPFAMVLTQDCDLEQDYRVRSQGKDSDKLLPGVLFCELATAKELYGQIRQINPKFWDRIKINKDERYHFLQKIEAADDALKEGLPELAIDFKRYFTLPTEEIYRRIEIGEAKRRCVLVSPYLEHLSSRFAYFLSRVALPIDYISE